MATEYISRESALDCFHDWIDRYGHEHSADEIVEYQRIEDLPVADVRPVVRGKWIFKGFMTVKCSNCDECFHELEGDNFCPNCGADMREDLEECRTE